MRAEGIEQWDDAYPDRTVLEADVARGTLYTAHVADGCLAGIIVLDERQPGEYTTVPWTIPAARVLMVHRLAVHPRYQGQGVARALMDFAEAHAAAHGYQAIRLDTFRHNPRACALYVHRGYHQAGTVEFRKGTFLVFEKAIVPDCQEE